MSIIQSAAGVDIEVRGAGSICGKLARPLPHLPLYYAKVVGLIQLANDMSSVQMSAELAVISVVPADGFGGVRGADRPVGTESVTDHRCAERYKIRADSSDDIDDFNVLGHEVHGCRQGVALLEKRRGTHDNLNSLRVIEI